MGGLILDSTVTIRAERERLPVTECLSRIRLTRQFNNVGLSDIGVTELFHGIYRADSTERAMRRRSYLAAFLIQLPVFDYQLQVAEIAGRIHGEQTERGNVIPSIDLMIGATALANGFSLLTTNLRHFRQIPDHDVIPF